MAQGTDLLRLLEPAVRPVAPAGRTPGTQGVRAGQTPFESQDFESLLASARQELPGLDTVQDESFPHDEPKRPPGPLDALADFGRIENPGLREMLALRESQESEVSSEVASR